MDLKSLRPFYEVKTQNPNYKTKISQYVPAKRKLLPRDKSVEFCRKLSYNLELLVKDLEGSKTKCHFSSSHEIDMIS